MRAAIVFAAFVLVARPAAAGAQWPDRPIGNASGTLTAGAEVIASLSPADDVAFFNYTDYDNSATRMARLRLLGEWRPHRQLSFVTEVRVGTNMPGEVAALFARWRPVARWNFDIQAGRVPPVIGAFPRRAYGRDNPLVGMPLMYQYLTSLRPDALPATMDDILRMRARGWRPSYPIGSSTIAPGLPTVTAFNWDTGVEAHWSNRRVDLAAAWTRGAPARPVVKETNDGQQWSGRAALMFPAGLTIGVSGARGAWIDQAALDLTTVAPGVSTTQTTTGADVGFERGHWILRGEYQHITFGIPVKQAPTFTTPLVSDAAFVEGRYRFLSRWQVAARADWLTFSRIQGALFGGAPTPWDAPVTRVEGAVGLRIARTVEVRGGYQYNWRDGGRVHRLGVPTLQFLYWF